jgi:hypothetical protein
VSSLNYPCFYFRFDNLEFRWFDSTERRTHRPKEKEVKLKTLKDKDLLRPITIDNEIRIMEDIIDEIKAKHTAPDDVKLKRLEKKFEPVEKILV